MSRLIMTATSSDFMALTVSILVAGAGGLMGNVSGSTDGGRMTEISEVAGAKGFSIMVHAPSIMLMISNVEQSFVTRSVFFE